jgi:hypothetical protein
MTASLMVSGTGSDFLALPSVQCERCSALRQLESLASFTVLMTLKRKAGAFE